MQQTETSFLIPLSLSGPNTENIIGLQYTSENINPSMITARK